jgi:hypothetical protein
VPPFGSRVICLEQEFRAALTQDFNKASSRRAAPATPGAQEPFAETRGYVRVSVRNGQTVGIQLVESIERGEQGTVFNALSW